MIYMPMMAEAIFAMLACVRLGAIHSVVFGGFAAMNLATRIDDAKPKVMVTANAGMRAGNVIEYRPLVDEALELAEFPPESVVICRRLEAGVSTMRSCASATQAREYPSNGLSPASRATSSTPPALPGRPKACSATRADTRSL